MKIVGDLNQFNVDMTESAAGTYTETQVVIADNVVAGNAILIKKIEFEAQEPQDVAAAGAAMETNRIHVARSTRTTLGDIADDEVLAAHQVAIGGNGTDNISIVYNKMQNPMIFGLGEKDGELYPYKFIYVAIKSSNGGATATCQVRIWYYPVVLNDKELLEVTQEAIIN
jgi:hypothetical protein